MKIILEIPELEAIVRENIASKYPNQDAKVTVQNKRNGVEVTVVLTDKTTTKATETFQNISEELVATDCRGTTENPDEEEADFPEEA